MDAKILHDKKYVCPQCGTQVEKDTVHCPNCGAKIDFKNETYSSNNPTLYTAVGIICAIISMMGGPIMIIGSVLCGYQLYKYKVTKERGVVVLVIAVVCGIIGLSQYF